MNTDSKPRAEPSAIFKPVRYYLNDLCTRTVKTSVWRFTFYDELMCQIIETDIEIVGVKSDDKRYSRAYVKKILCDKDSGRKFIDCHLQFTEKRVYKFRLSDISVIKDS